MANPAFSTGLRSDRINNIATRAGSGALLLQYSGTRPATGAAIGASMLLATHVMGSPLAPVSVNGTLVCTLPANVNAVATNTGAWARLTTSAGVFVADFDLALSGTNVIVMNSLGYTAGVACQVLQFDIADGNA